MRTLVKKEERIAFLQLHGWQQDDNPAHGDFDWFSSRFCHFALNTTTAISCQRNYNAATVLVNKLCWENRPEYEHLCTTGKKYVRPPGRGQKWKEPIPALRKLRNAGFTPRLSAIEWGYKEAIRVPTTSLPSRNGMLSMWCIYCDQWHHHGRGIGHRVAHCIPLYDTPYRSRGYILGFDNWHWE